MLGRGAQVVRRFGRGPHCAPSVGALSGLSGQHEALRLLLAATQLQQQFDGFVQQAGAEALRSEDRVRVARSSVCDESGLFASADLEAGQVVGFYPVHAVGMGDDRGLHRWVLPQDASHFEEAANDPDQHHYLQGLTHPPVLQLVSRCAAQGMFIDISPHRPLQPCWLGHIINDVAVCRSGEANVLHYLRAGLERANCFNVPLGPAPLMCYVTTAPVRAGEELLTSYFPSFWLSADELPDLESSHRLSRRRRGASRRGASRSRRELIALTRHLDARVVACERAVTREFKNESAMLADWMASWAEKQKAGGVAEGARGGRAGALSVHHIFVQHPQRIVMP